MRLVWTGRARADLDELFDYILRDDPLAAMQRYPGQIYFLALKVAQDPLISPFQ